MALFKFLVFRLQHLFEAPLIDILLSSVAFLRTALKQVNTVMAAQQLDMITGHRDFSTDAMLF